MKLNLIRGHTVHKEIMIPSRTRMNKLQLYLARYVSLLFIAFVATAPVYLVTKKHFGSQAADSNNLEPKNGALLGNVAIISSQNAPDRRYIVFNSNETQTAPGEPIDKGACVNVLAQNNEISSAINSAKTSAAKCVYVPHGMFNWGGFITLDGVKIVGDGDASVLYAPVAKGSRLILTGPNTGLYSLKIKVDIDPNNVVTHADQGGGDLIVLDENASKFVIDNVTITGARSRGILVHAAHDGRITRNRLSNITAGPYHIEGGAYNIYVAGNAANWFGDDGVGITSEHLHPEASTISHDILVENNVLNNQTRGRGLLVHGGKNVTFRNNTIIKASAPALMLQPTMRDQNPFEVDNILVEGNTFRDSPSVEADSYSGAILIKLTGRPYVGLGRVSNVQFTNNKLYASPNAIFNIGSDTGPNIRCSNNTYNDSVISPTSCVDGVDPIITGAGIDATILDGTTVPFPNN